MTTNAKAETARTTDAPATNHGANVIFVAYSIGQRVTIDAIDTRGRVKAINVATGATEYQVAYFDDDKVRRVEWFEVAELTA